MIPSNGADTPPFYFVKINRDWAGFLIGVLDWYKAVNRTHLSLSDNTEIDHAQLVLMGDMGMNAFRAQKSTSQTITPNSFTKVVFGNTVISNSGWDSSQNRFIFGADGLTIVSASIWAGGNTSALEIRLNGTSVARGDSGSDGCSQVTSVLQINQDDYVEIWCSANSSSLSSGNRSFLWVVNL